MCTHNNRIGYGTGRCLQYGWDWFILFCPTKQETKRTETFVGWKFTKNVSLTGTNKLKHETIYNSLCPKCFERWLPTNYVWWFTNQMSWMTSNVFESWMLRPNVHSKSQKWKVLLIMNNYATHALKHVGGGWIIWFFNIAIEQYCYYFLTT